MIRKPATPIRVLLVDDHAIVRAGLGMLLAGQPDIAVAADAATCAEGLAAAAREQPDVVLLDLALGGESGLDLLEGLRAAAPEACVILLTGVADTQAHRRAVRLGVMGIVMKDQAADELIQAIRRVHAGEVWLEPALVASVLSDMAGRGTPAPRDAQAARIASLTERERAIIALICEGLPNKQVGQRLAISEITVRHHLTSIFDKLGVANRLELVIYAYRHNLAKIPG